MGVWEKEDEGVSGRVGECRRFSPGIQWGEGRTGWVILKGSLGEA